MTEQQREKPAMPGAADSPESRRRLARKQRLDKLLDEALEGTFPASDPIALTPRPSVPRN